MDEPRFATPEEAALASWAHSPAAGARVVRVTVVGDRAEVLIEVADGYPDHVCCDRVDGGWEVGSSGNGPNIGWQDPDR